MSVTATGINKILTYMGSVFDKIVLTDATGSLTAEKTPVVTVSTDRVICTAYFGTDEANFTIKTVQLWAGADLIATKDVNVIKTSRQSLTVTRRDYLREAA
jgi:hypothetical protein